MIAYHVAALVCGAVGILTSMIGTCACIYNLYTTSRNSLSILEQKVKDLKDLLEDIHQKVNMDGVFKPGSVDPSKWIEDVNILIDKHDKVDLGGCLHESCLNWAVPNVCNECRTWLSIEEDTRKINTLLKEGENFKVIGYKRTSKEVFGSDFKKLRDKIWKEVSQEKKVQVVFIRGIACVGKTLMASTIHNLALEEMKDDLESVIWVQIGLKSVIKDIQEDIAGQLPSVNLSTCTDDSSRAKELLGALSRKKALLVLDYLPMWQDFHLDRIGIPQSGDNWKLIIASRSLLPCTKVKGSFPDRSRIYEIKPLSPEDAWKLFLHSAGPNRRHIKDEIYANTELAVKDLDGLPSAIKMLAKALKEIPDDNPTRIVNAWNSELLKLSSSGTLLGNKSQKFFDKFKDIFERLGEVPLSCFVYCLLFPKGHKVKAKELIEYWMWEGLLGEVSSLEETMGTGGEVFSKLEEAHLLEIIDEGGPEESVRMLNVIRLVAMNAAATSGQRFFINCGNSLKELPPAKDWPPNTERASFVHNEISALKSGLDCKNLSTLLLQNNKPSGLIVTHNKFFSNLVNLRVLNLSCTGFSSLPSSLGDLKNLHALLLHNCHNLTSLPSLSKLQKLLVLDLSGTPLKELPKGLNNLSSLRRLDLSQNKLQVFRPEEVGQLTQIEELLLLCNSGGKLVWGSNKNALVLKGLCIEELKNLKRLAVLQLNFLNTAVFIDFLNTAEFEKNDARPGVAKRSFKFFVGKVYNNDVHAIGDNSLTIVQDHNATLPEGTAELNLMRCAKKLPSLNIDGCFKYLTVLNISDFDELEYVLTWEVLYNLEKLKKIQVKRCWKTVSIIKPDTKAKHVDLVVPELTTLVLHDLPELMSICDCQELNCPSLQKVEVLSCHIMKLPEILQGTEREVLIRGDKKWLEREKKRKKSSSFTFKYEEIPQLTDIELPSSSGLPSALPEQPNKSAGEATPSRWGSLEFILGLVFLPGTGALNRDDANQKDSVLSRAVTGPPQRRLDRNASSRSN